MIPNDETRSYAGQFETETRAIYYVMMIQECIVWKIAEAAWEVWEM